MKSKVFPIYLVFLCMGFGDFVGPVVSLAKETFQLSNFMAQLIPFSGFIMFGLLSIPMGLYQDKKGRKHTLLLGLTVAFIGMIPPMLAGMYGKNISFVSGEYFPFYMILLAFLMLCAGATILQVVGNPIMRDVSPEGTFAKNLTFAQSVKAVGSSLGYLLPPLVTLYFGLSWSALFPILAVLLLLTFLLVLPMKITEYKDVNSKPASISSCFALLKNGYVLLMVMGIFFYVGAEVSVSANVPILLKKNFGFADYSLWLSWALFFLPILVSRFFGALILNILSPKKFFIITAFVAIAGILMIFSGNLTIVFAGVVLTGLGFGNIFPLIFSLAIDKMPERANELSGLMVTAIVGGALLPPIMGQVADMTSLETSFIIPLLCLIYIAVVAFLSLGKTKTLAA